MSREQFPSLIKNNPVPAATTSNASKKASLANTLRADKLAASTRASATANSTLGNNFPSLKKPDSESFANSIGIRKSNIKETKTAKKVVKKGVVGVVNNSAPPTIKSTIKANKKANKRDENFPALSQSSAAVANGFVTVGNNKNPPAPLTNGNASNGANNVKTKPNNENKKPNNENKKPNNENKKSNNDTKSKTNSKKDDDMPQWLAANNNDDPTSVSSDVGKKNKPNKGSSKKESGKIESNKTESSEKYKREPTGPKLKLSDFPSLLVDSNANHPMKNYLNGNNVSQVSSNSQWKDKISKNGNSSNVQNGKSVKVKTPNNDVKKSDPPKSSQSQPKTTQSSQWEDAPKPPKPKTIQPPKNKKATRQAQLIDDDEFESFVVSDTVAGLGQEALFTSCGVEASSNIKTYKPQNIKVEHKGDYSAPPMKSGKDFPSLGGSSKKSASNAMSSGWGAKPVVTEQKISPEQIVNTVEKMHIDVDKSQQKSKKKKGRQQTYEYYPPPNFEDRNLKLIKIVTDCCGTPQKFAE